jgi:hypothetical protein
MSAAHTRALFGSDLELLLAFLSLIPPTQEPSANRFARRRPCAIDRPGMHSYKLVENKLAYYRAAYGRRMIVPP